MSARRAERKASPLSEIARVLAFRSRCLIRRKPRITAASRQIVHVIQVLDNAFRVTSGRISRSTQVKGREWVLIEDKSREAETKKGKRHAGDDPAFTPRDVTAAQIPVAPQACWIVLSL